MSDHDGNPLPGPRASRFLAGLGATLLVDGGTFGCSVVNLSRSGALVSGRFPDHRGADVRLRLSSSHGDLKVEATATVSRRTADTEANAEEGTAQLALEFATMEPDSRSDLDALVSRVVEGMAPAALAALEQSAGPVEIRQALEQISVAHRINLAVRGSARERQLLLLDTNPQVLDSLARNPNLTPVDLRALLRIRNLLPRTLESLARDGKWRGTEPLQILIACHPNAPMAVGERIAAALTPAGKAQLIRQPGLNTTLRLKLGGARGKR